MSLPELVLLKTELNSPKTRKDFLHGKNINKPAREKDKQLLAFSAGCWLQRGAALDWRLTDDESEHKHLLIINTLISRSQRKIKQKSWFVSIWWMTPALASESFSLSEALQQRGPHQLSLITESELHTQSHTAGCSRSGCLGSVQIRRTGGVRGEVKKITCVGFEWVSRIKLPELHAFLQICDCVKHEYCKKCYDCSEGLACYTFKLT